MAPYLYILLLPMALLEQGDRIPIQPSLVFSTVEVELSILAAFHEFHHFGLKYGSQCPF